MKMSDMSKSTFGHSLVIALQVKVFQHKKNQLPCIESKGPNWQFFAFCHIWYFHSCFKVFFYHVIIT